LKQQTSSPAAAAEAEKRKTRKRREAGEGRGGGGREAQLSSILPSSVNIGTVTNNLSTKYQLSSEGREKKKKKWDEEEEG
jgi:hypothetical protein